MIGPALDLNQDILRHLLTDTIPVTIIGMLMSLTLNWIVAQYLLANVPLPQDTEHSWLRNLPVTPLLMLAALVLPFVELGFVLNCLLLAVLLLPCVCLALVCTLRTRATHDPYRQLPPELRFQAIWQDTMLIAGAFVVGDFFAVALVTKGYDYVVDALPDLPLSLVVGVLIGVVLGIALTAARHWIIDLLARRHRQEEYSWIIEGPLGMVQSSLESQFTQLHASNLIGVLMISAAGLSFSDLPTQVMLILFFMGPITSAILSAFLDTDPRPGDLGPWQHLRAGLANTAQIGAGFLIGAALLSPLHLVDEWITAQSDQFSDALTTHLDLTFSALSFSMLLGMVGGVLSSRFEALRALLINLGNIGRTIPSLAVLALALPIFGVGRDPSLVALIFIGALPILVNTSVGIIEVSPDVKEAARGMGMNDLQVLVRIEIPVAIPVIMAGIRTSAVLIVASAALAGFIGGGGLGDLINRGDSSGRDDILLTGAIFATMLAIFLEYFFGWLEKVLTPRGLRES
jgi:osmoprotectant transport system permease protein